MMAHGYSAEATTTQQEFVEDTNSGISSTDARSNTTGSSSDDNINILKDATSVAPFTPNAVLKENATRDALQRQLEYYFSLENLKQDPYLVSQMNSDQFVLISTVANFKLVRSLTEDVGLITSVLQSSEMVELNDSLDKVRPVHSLKRTTIIIRDTPEGTEEGDVLEIFKRDSTCPIPAGVRADIGNTWFVAFDNEENTRDALFKIRDMKIGDAPIRARIKSENLLRSTGFAPKNMEMPILGMEGQYNMGMMPMHMPPMGVGKDNTYTDNAEMYPADMYYQQPMYYPGWIPQYYPGSGMVPQYQQPYAHMMNGDHRRHSQHSNNGYTRGGRRHSNREWHHNQKKYSNGNQAYAHQNGHAPDSVEGEYGAEGENGEAQREYGNHGNGYANGAYNNAKQRKMQDKTQYAHTNATNGANGVMENGTGESAVNGVVGGGDNGASARQSYGHHNTHREGGRKHHKNNRNGGYHGNGNQGNDANGHHHRNHNNNYKANHRNNNSNNDSHSQHTANSKANAGGNKPASFDTTSFPPLPGDGKDSSTLEPTKPVVPTGATSSVNKLADIVKASIDNPPKANANANANGSNAQSSAYRKPHASPGTAPRKHTHKKGAHATPNGKDEHKHSKKDATGTPAHTTAAEGTLVNDTATKKTTPAATTTDAKPPASVAPSAPVLKISDPSKTQIGDSPTPEEQAGGAKKTSWAQMMKTAPAVPMATAGVPAVTNENLTAPASPAKATSPKKHSTSPKPKRNNHRQNGDRRKDQHAHHKRDKTARAVRRDE